MLLNSLRSRLLISYFIVVGVALVLVGVALLGIATFSTVRYLPTLQQLLAIGTSNRRELLSLRDNGADGATIERVLDETAVEQQVRILAANARTRQVIYDSEETESWVGVFINDVNRPARLSLNADGGSIIGRFQHPTNGSRWLIYAPPLPNFNRLIVFYARQEPTPQAFFQEFFFRPLLIAGALAFLLSILLAYVMARSVARPLQQLAFAAEGVAHGDYDQRLAVNGPTEIQLVAGSFNSMATQVKTAQQIQRDFVANVSHDLKTPITSVRGWSQALLDGTAVTAAEQHQAATVIHSEAARMSRMVDQLLDLARIESGQLELQRQTLDLAQLISEVVQNLEPYAQDKGLIINVDLQPVPAILGDRDRLIQLFTNLVDNAIIYSPGDASTQENGQVQVTVWPFSVQETAVTITDNGPGIPAAELPRIFERFYQVDKSRTRGDEERGAGLGLAIARELVEAHNGRLTVASESGRGSTFTVYLPC